MASPIPGARPDYVRALHDFHSSSQTGTATLSFSAGQVIRVFSKDASGWWDGELDGLRGWFPSNYVELLEGGIGEGPEEDEAEDGPYEESGLGVSVAPVRRGSQPRDASAEGQLLTVIDRAVKSLQDAVHAARANHFQPGTACVISAVRSVLSATDTLTRRSPALKSSPALGDARKRILNALATLVHQARVASAPTLRSGSPEAAQEAARMMDQAEAVVDHVTVFLDECAKAGVRVQAKSPELGRDGQEGGMNLGLRAARSGQDLRREARRPTLTVTTAGGQGGEHQSVFSPDSAVPHEGGEDDEQDPFAHAQTITSAPDLMALLSALQDTLLSSVAALIGHVHAHTRSAHGASYAQLVDLTRSTIERVREMLLVIEGVLASEPSILPSSAERKMLAGCRERLYEATTALATAARVATGPAREGEGEEEEKDNLLATSHAVLRCGNDAIGAVKVCVTQLGNREIAVFINDISAPSTVNHNEPEQANGAGLLAPGGGNRSGRRGANTISMLGRKATSLSCLKERFDADGQLGGVGEEGEEEEEEDEADKTATEINGLSIGTDAHGRKGSYASSIATTSDTVTSAQSNTPSPASLDHNSAAAQPGANGERAPSRAGSGGSLAMARQDSSRTSESAASSRSALSRSSTNDTSPRSSVSTAPDSRKWSAEQHPPAMPAFSPMFSTRPGSVGQQSSRLSSSSTPGSAGHGQGEDRWYLKRDYDDKEVTFNQNGHVTGGTLRCLVERATLHDTTIDPAFLGAFLLTFRLFVSPVVLFQSLVDRFEMQPPSRADKPALTEAELKVWQDSKLTPVRLRIYNFFKTWVESNWNAEADAEVIEPLLAFARGSLAAAMPSAAQRLVDTVQKRVVAAASSPEPAQAAQAQPQAARPRMLNRMISSDRLKAGKLLPAAADPYTHPLPSGPSPPAPVLGKSLLAALRTGALTSVIEIDPLELARQLTIKESRVYLAIKPSELLGHSRKGKGNGAPNVSQMSALSTKLTGWVSETILHETDAKRRAGLVKYFIKLSQQCLALNNYNALMAVICALTSSTISRLRKTWDGLAPKYRTLLEQLKRATEHSRNYAEYRSKLRNAVPPALPFVGLFLTDLTFSFEGNPAERPSPSDAALRLINFDRYQKMARIIQEQQRFQVPYNLLEVAEIQEYLDKALAGLKHDRNGDSLWRQSLLVEPRNEGAAEGQAPQTASGGGGIGHDLFGWTR